MAKKELLIIADYSEHHFISLDEICELYGIPPELIDDFIAHDIIRPTTNSRRQWIFDETQLRRIKMALRLQHDLEINVAGVALALDLLEKLEQLRIRAELLEKHLLKF